MDPMIFWKSRREIVSNVHPCCGLRAGRRKLSNNEQHCCASSFNRKLQLAHQSPRLLMKVQWRRLFVATYSFTGMIPTPEINEDEHRYYISWSTSKSNELMTPSLTIWFAFLEASATTIGREVRSRISLCFECLKSWVNRFAVKWFCGSSESTTKAWSLVCEVMT